MYHRSSIPQLRLQPSQGPPSLTCQCNDALLKYAVGTPRNDPAHALFRMPLYTITIGAKEFKQKLKEPIQSISHTLCPTERDEHMSNATGNRIDQV